MKAVWRVARASVRRRGLQTVVIAVVVGISTATIVLALALLTTASAPFDRAHAQQSGAHLVTAFDRAVVSDAQVADTADRSLVAASAGPFAQATVDTSTVSRQQLPPSLTLVGRADPGGAVDRLNVWEGRWATEPGELVLNYIPGMPGPMSVGDRISVPGSTFTVVGFAYSISKSADAWVTPEQVAELSPTTTQMLYRFTASATAADIAAGKASITEGLPAGALLGAEPYLAIKQDIASESAVYIPFLVVFGVLGVAVAVLIVANVIGGAVVAGYRDIGMLKALGFTPNQVMTVYLVIVTVPAVVGCVLGVVLGNLVARPLLTEAFESFGSSDMSVDLWVSVLALLAMPAVVALAALVSALRARGLPAAEAISAGSAPRAGRALRIQRWLGGLRLPRSVSLGLGVPFARPARSALTLASVVLGVLTATLAIGVMLSVTAYRDAVSPEYTDRVRLVAPLVGGGPRMAPVEPGETQTPPVLTDEEDEALLRSLPGAAEVAAVAQEPVRLVGSREVLALNAFRGDTALGPRLDSGRRPTGPAEVAAPSRFLNQQGLAVGDTITLEHEGTRTQVTIVAVTVTNSAGELFADWPLIQRLAPEVRANSYLVQFSQQADQQAYVDAVEAAEPGLEAVPLNGGSSSQAVVLISSATVLTIVLGAVAALGVFNTVVLNARERRRDLGMLKSIGMTPRQVTVMMVTSMGALGVVGGLVGVPLGVAAHQVVAPAMMRAAQSAVFDFVLDVYRVPVLVLLGLAGVVIAVFGALLPARSAARTPIATVLHNE